jgi:hypothetical protein
MKLIVGIFAGVAALSLTAQAHTVYGPVDRGVTLVARVNSVHLGPMLRNTTTGRRSVTISASGTVSTGGWSRPRLIPQSTQPSTSETYTLDFRATPPPGFTTHTRSRELEAQYTLQNPPRRIRFIRVVATRNSILQRLR